MITRKLVFATLLLVSGVAFAQTEDNQFQIEPVNLDEWVPESRMDQQDAWKAGEYAYPAKPRNMWQIGLNLGVPYVSGDTRIDILSPAHSPSWGVGLNIRKGLGYVTSIRLNGNFGYAYGQDYDYSAKANNKVLNGQFEGSTNPDKYSDGADYSDSLWVNNYQTNIINGNLDLIFNLNNINFHNATPKTYLYLFMGGGVLTYNTKHDALNGTEEYFFDVIFDDGDADQNDPDVIQQRLDDIRALLDGEYDIQAEIASQKKNGNTVINPAFSLGGGISWKLGTRVELGLEHRATYIFDDLIDGERWEYARSGGDYFETGNFSDHKDIVHYTYLNLGINLGSKDKNTIPTWEVNPLNYMYNKIAEIDPNNLLRDSDDDGVIDRLDREPNTPAGTPVDTHGVALDSDKDGCKDSEDPEPFSTPNLPIENCQNQWLAKDDVQQMIDDAIGKIKPSTAGGTWILPMIFFDLDKYNIRASEVYKMQQVLEIMKKYPSLKVEVVGNTDVRASEGYNMTLSENRAKEAINWLTKNGIDGGRFIMKYNGESAPLIPNARNEVDHQQNRRVEFHVAN
jgi:outer membrane protein OmpA-like peptidoglycan-associated protein